MLCRSPRDPDISAISLPPTVAENIAESIPHHDRAWYHSVHQFPLGWRLTRKAPDCAGLGPSLVWRPTLKKNQESPLPPGVKQVIDGVRQFQQKVNEITGRTEKPEFTKGTIDPTIKK